MKLIMKSFYYQDDPDYFVDSSQSQSQSSSQSTQSSSAVGPSPQKESS